MNPALIFFSLNVAGDNVSDKVRRKHPVIGLDRLLVFLLGLGFSHRFLSGLKVGPLSF